jgi:hypothetical protein
MNEEMRCLLIEHARRFDERLDAEMRRLEQLRAADAQAITVAHEGVRERMEGFPQQYATKSEQDAIKETAQRLEKDSVSREIYDQAMNRIRSDVSAKLEKQTFEATLGEWVTWRRQVEQRLSASSGVSQGISRTFAWGLAAVGAMGTAVGLILAFNS